MGLTSEPPRGRAPVPSCPFTSGFSSFSPSWALARIMASLACFRAFASPKGHKWQWPQAASFLQPSAFQNHAHGLHWPLPCSREPIEGKASMASDAVQEGAGGRPCSVRLRHGADDGGGTVGPPSHNSVAASSMLAPSAACAFFCFSSPLRRLISPAGHKWHRKHAAPFRHPCGFQNQAHGWQLPNL